MDCGKYIMEEEWFQFKKNFNSNWNNLKHLQYCIPLTYKNKNCQIFSHHNYYFIAEIAWHFKLTKEDFMYPKH